jgi:hypothetical protein
MKERRMDVNEGTKEGRNGIVWLGREARRTRNGKKEGVQGMEGSKAWKEGR